MKKSTLFTAQNDDEFTGWFNLIVSLSMLILSRPNGVGGEHKNMQGYGCRYV